MNRKLNLWLDGSADIAADFDFNTFFKILSAKLSHRAFQLKSMQYNGRMESFKRRKSAMSKD